MNPLLPSAFDSVQQNAAVTQEASSSNITSAEYGTIRSKYADLNLSANMNDYNLIEITASQLSDANLRNAINTAGTTTKDDLIVVRTTASQNAITLSGTELAIDIDNAMYGSVTIASLGDSALTLDANQQSHVFFMSATMPKSVWQD